MRCHGEDHEIEREMFDARDEPPVEENFDHAGLNEAELDELERLQIKDCTEVPAPPAHLQAELDDALASFWRGIEAGTIKEGAML